MPLGNLAAKIREVKTPSALGAENKTELPLQEKISAELQEKALDNIPSEVKTIDELTPLERKEFEAMNIDPTNVDQILATPHGLVVSTGGKRWIEARLGKKPVSEVEMQQLKADYNRLLSELRKLEKNMTSEDIPAHKMLMDKLSGIYEAIVCGGYAITPEETRRGFKLTIIRSEN